MIKHELNNIVFVINPQRDQKLHETVRNNLINIGDISMDILVYMALNQLTINQLVSASLTTNMERICQERFSNYSYVDQSMIMHTCEQIAALLYADYCSAISTAHMPLPARMVDARYGNCAITMIFESMDDQSCKWSYTTLLQ